MRFEWDPGKGRTNVKKHGVGFEEAVTVFDDPFALVAPDPKHSKLEEREWIIGESDRGILVVVYTKRDRGDICRIISARRASRKERKNYEEYKAVSF